MHMTSITIVWICIGILTAIFFIAVIGIICVNKANKTTLSTERVACAGSVDIAYPATVKIKLPNDPLLFSPNISREERESLKRFIVKGNSMQYAKINTNDFVYVKNAGIDDIRHNLPKICLLMFSPKSPHLADRKIRRTWSIINSNISNKEFEECLDNILRSDNFCELRSTMGDKCPSDEELKSIAFNSLNRYRVNHTDPQELLLSTTFRTERNRLEFSIHPSSSLLGVVGYVSHPIEKSHIA